MTFIVDYYTKRKTESDITSFGDIDGQAETGFLIRIGHGKALKALHRTPCDNMLKLFIWACGQLYRDIVPGLAVENTG
jgi:hypothetical protein